MPYNQLFLFFHIPILFLFMGICKFYVDITEQFLSYIANM
jgi:hypothetical protein